VTPEPTTCLPVRTSYPDTIGTHPTTHGMSGPLRKNLCIDYASEHDPAAVGYWFLFGTTSDNTTCYIRAHSRPYASAIFLVFGSPVPGLDWTRTSQDQKSQDHTGPQRQSSLRSFAISRIPGLVKDQSGPVWTSLLIGKFINILSIFRTLIY